jgi:hypothetical protein
MTLTITWFDVCGMVGVALVLAAYALLTAGRLVAQGAVYLLLNLAGSAAILVSLTQAFNLSAFVIQIAWIAISIYGLLRAWRGRRAGQAS